MSSPRRSVWLLLVVAAATIPGIPVNARAGDNPLQVGVSIGARRIVGDRDRAFNATISPLDSTLKLDPIDRGAAVLSATAVLFPWYSKAATGPGWRGLGIAVHADVAVLGSSASTAGFNRTIEGGLGIAYRMSEQSAIAISWEKVKNRFPRDYVRNLRDRQISADGAVLTKLDAGDDRFFRDDFLDAVGIKVLWFPAN